MTRLQLSDFNTIPDTSDRYGRLSIVKAEDVEEKQVEFLDPEGFIPIGALTLVQGDPGLGKSTWTFYQAAKVTQGGRSVLISSLEDPWGSIIRPRLLAAGADLGMVGFLQCDDHPGFSISKSDYGDIRSLEALVEDTETRLLIVDPFMGHMSADIDTYRDQDVRKALSPLSQMAERNEMAVLVVHHLTKDSGRTDMYRGGGSLGGIQGGIRSGIMFEVTAGHNDDGPYRTVRQYKHSWSTRRHPMNFELGETTEGVSYILPRQSGILPHTPKEDEDGNGHSYGDHQRAYDGW